MKKKYLTIEEKKKLALSGQDVPLCISLDTDKNRNGFICKIRSIWDGSLRKKKIKLWLISIVKNLIVRVIN